MHVCKGVVARAGVDACAGVDVRAGVDAYLTPKQRYKRRVDEDHRSAAGILLFVHAVIPVPLDGLAKSRAIEPSVVTKFGLRACVRTND